MKRPRRPFRKAFSLNLVSFRFDVLYANLLPKRYGMYFFRHKTIFIEPTIDSDIKESTLLHEILEHITKLQNIEIEHEDLERMENLLYPILKDNNLFFGRGKPFRPFRDKPPKELA